MLYRSNWLRKKAGAQSCSLERASPLYSEGLGLGSPLAAVLSPGSEGPSGSCDRQSRAQLQLMVRCTQALPGVRPWNRDLCRVACLGMEKMTYSHLSSGGCHQATPRPLPEMSVSEWSYFQGEQTIPVCLCTVLPRLGINSWVQGILLSQPPE